ncbi:RNA 2',3'-cyclic phosphodiesterase [Lacisediminimonas profundi]|uniref:RNA 2',3'-cyclic phosphodiesterase n=1 Tax=Lacisediminimonas profundi TaxID=2603856 RepID=UPI00124AF099|nr:RNA 2',3'-cyclic phosphodiesterase [Lacisediminimonas profundi]
MPLNDKPPASVRLFFALWPSPPVRAALASLLPAVTGRRVKAEHLHITMVFLGQQQSDRIPELLAIARAVPFPAMPLVIDEIGYFRRNRIAWAGSQHPPPALLDVRRELVDALAQAGFEFDSSSAFKTHVTLARDAAPPPVSQFEPVIWELEGIALVSSHYGANGLVYTVLND